MPAGLGGGAGFKECSGAAEHVGGGRVVAVVGGFEVARGGGVLRIS